MYNYVYTLECFQIANHPKQQTINLYRFVVINAFVCVSEREREPLHHLILTIQFNTRPSRTMLGFNVTPF